jgi:tRNA dimethylallyltransferase
MAMSPTMAEATPTRPRAVLLLGPTASGKSALAMHLARHLPLEIVTVDSAQVYRGMDIGTAKPGPAERAAVPHHLLDLRDPAEPYSAAEFVRDATTAVHAIAARGRLPLLVGGTMLYARALRDGLSRLPAADAAVRAELSARAAAQGWPALHAELARADPATAARLAPADSQRIQRALEVFILTGVPLAELQRAPQPAALAITTVALMPADRAQLRARIAARFDGMLAAGLLDEVRALKTRADLHLGLPSMRCVGYRQAWEHLDRGSSAADLRAAGIAATAQLAKRQLTWLRSMTDVHRLPAETATAQALRELIEAGG